jgi:cytochrome P450
MLLSSQEMNIFLEEWLARIPDFSADPEDPPIMATGIVRGLTRPPLRWDV